jgi:LmbE family N-acetylglucosaminyl deacetylase
MKLNRPNAEFFIPSKIDIIEAVKKTTHMSIAAHQDDIEIMAYDGILKCYQNNNLSFYGVVVTNGAGSARDGEYKNYSDQKMQEIRKKEQIKAAVIGKYGALTLLDYPSKDTKDPSNSEIVKELSELIKLASPEVLYTHNLADKHDTHLGVTSKVIKAIRLLDKELRPEKLYGCEVWRNLDWMLDSEKVIFDVSGNPKLALDLISIFKSQIAGGKRYDLATIGRRLANATYSTSHAVDTSDALIYAMDLTPLILDDNLEISSYVTAYIERFMKVVVNKMSKVMK